MYYYSCITMSTDSNSKRGNSSDSEPDFTDFTVCNGEQANLTGQLKAHLFHMKSLQLFIDYISTSGVYRPFNEISGMCDMFSGKLLAPVNNVNRTCTILGCLFTYITNADDEFLTSMCNLIMMLLYRNDLYHHAIVYNGCNIYKHMQQCCNLELSDNKAQLELIAQIATYYIGNDEYEHNVHDVIDKLNGTSIGIVYETLSMYVKSKMLIC